METAKTMREVDSRLSNMDEAVANSRITQKYVGEGEAIEDRNRKALGLGPFDPSESNKYVKSESLISQVRVGDDISYASDHLLSRVNSERKSSRDIPITLVDIAYEGEVNEAQDICEQEVSCDEDTCEAPCSDVCDEDIEEDHNDIIGYKAPKSLFRRNIPRGHIYIKVRGNEVMYRPIGITSNDFDLPKEIVHSWDKVTDGSKGYYMKLDRENGESTEVRFDSDNVWFGRTKIPFKSLKRLIMGYELMTEHDNVPWGINVPLVNIGCQSGIYMYGLVELYKQINKLNAARELR